jgi:hypothetical protein
VAEPANSQIRPPSSGRLKSATWSSCGCTPDGTRVIVGSGKGSGTGPNRVKRPIDGNAPTVSFQHHGNQLNGLVSFIDTPDTTRLAAMTKQVYDNALYRDALLETSGAGTETVIPRRSARHRRSNTCCSS